MPPFLPSRKIVKRTESPCAAASKPGFGPSRRTLERLVVLRLDDFLAAVVAVRADVVTQMHFTRARLDSQRRAREEIVRAVHAALRRRLLVLLNCHDNS
ncbi:hypothetical protein PSAC2689_30110 [Paraburkholderia sacchari]